MIPISRKIRTYGKEDHYEYGKQVARNLEE